MRDALIARYLRTPNHPGKLRLVRLLQRVIPEVGVVARVDRGIRLYLHPADWIEYLLLSRGTYEPLTLAFLRANLGPGDGAVLAGVNFGLHVTVAAQAASPYGLVIGVEPQPAALVKARRNLQLNEVEAHALLVAAALGNEERIQSIAWSKPDNPGRASLLDQGNLSVAIVRMSSVLHLLDDRPFRLLLLDVEGSEEKVLMGMDWSKGPDLVVIEIEPELLDRAESSGARVAGTLSSVGYELFGLDGRPADSRLLNLPERNLVAVRSGVAVTWS